MIRAFFSKISAFDFAVTEYQIRAGLTLRKGHHYKYKSLCANPVEQVIEILRDSKLYFPSPSQLNDEDEGKPQLVIGDISDRTYWPQWRLGCGDVSPIERSHRLRSRFMPN